MRRVNASEWWPPRKLSVVHTSTDPASRFSLSRAAASYAECMRLPRFPLCLLAVLLLFPATRVPAQQSTWTFAVSGDSRNCGDFVMPAIAANVKAENDAFYWHLGDFRWMSQPDQDLHRDGARRQIPLATSTTSSARGTTS